MGHTYTIKYLLFICSSHLTGHPEFYQAAPPRVNTDLWEAESGRGRKERRKEGQKGASSLVEKEQGDLQI